MELMKLKFLFKLKMRLFNQISMTNKSMKLHLNWEILRARNSVKKLLLNSKLLKRSHSKELNLLLIMSKLNSDNKSIWNHKINCSSKINKNEIIVFWFIMYSQIIDIKFNHKFNLFPNNYNLSFIKIKVIITSDV